MLCYHRVARCPEDTENGLWVSPQIFEAQMQLLRKYYEPVSLLELVQNPKQGQVAITFDDGYGDFVKHALPALEKYSIPATVFVTSGLLGSSSPYWWDEVFLKLMKRPLQFPEAWKGREELESLYRRSTTQDWPRFRSVFFEMLCSDAKSEGEDWLRAGLSEWEISFNDPDARPLSREEFQSLMNNELVTIGAHTLSHPRLSSLDSESQRVEIVGSKEALENLTQHPVETFAYPFGGATEYNQDSVRVCEDAGFVCSVTTRRGVVHSKTPRMEIPRIYVQDWDQERFRKQLIRAQWTGLFPGSA